MNPFTIEKVQNGYICRGSFGIRVFHTIEEVFEWELQYFEGLTKSFSGTAYGEIIINREK
jgi:hypothetical protein